MLRSYFSGRKKYVGLAGITVRISSNHWMQSPIHKERSEVRLLCGEPQLQSQGKEASSFTRPGALTAARRRPFHLLNEDLTGGLDNGTSKLPWLPPQSDWLWTMSAQRTFITGAFYGVLLNIERAKICLVIWKLTFFHPIGCFLHLIQCIKCRIF